MGTQPSSGADLDAIEQVIDGWLAGEKVANPVIDAVERGEPGERRWYVRLKGEEKDFFTIWFTLGQRTLQHETYMLPAPEENQAAVYEQLLRRNRDLHGVQFAIGVEDAVFVVGRLDNDQVTPAALDQILGTVYATVERAFRPALRLAFASHFFS
jgi:hypothetical protein